MSRKRKSSLTQTYFREWELPFCLFLSISMLMFWIGGLLADPVLKGNEVAALIMLPSASSIGIAIAAIVSLSDNRVKAGILNLIAFVLSLICLPILFFGLCLIGMSY